MPISRVFVVFVLLAQLAWLVRPRFGHGEPSFDESYRDQERMLTYAAWKDQPSPTTEAAWQEELRRLHVHTRTRDFSLIALVLAFDGVLIYWFWNYGVRKTTAEQTRCSEPGDGAPVDNRRSVAPDR